MRLGLAGTLLAIAVLAGCQTTGTGSGGGTSGLPNATYPNVDPVPGVRYVALDRRTEELALGVVLSVLKVPGTARFDDNLVAAEAGHMVLVCGTLTGSDGNRSYSGVPYAVFIDFDVVRGGNFLDAAAVYGLFSTVARADAQLVATSPRVISAYCREMNGAVLPEFGAVAAAPATPAPSDPLAPRPR